MIETTWREAEAEVKRLTMLLREAREYGAKMKAEADRAIEMAERARRGVSALSKQLVETGAERDRLQNAVRELIDTHDDPDRTITRSARFHDLLAYSEWLDAEKGYIVGGKYPTHEELVGEYLGHEVCTKHDYGIEADCTCGD